MSQPVVASQQIVWDQAVLDKYNYSGPRYTSYPTALEFHEAFTVADYDMACTQYPERPLSLYIHIPFCHKLCYYCGCNKVITRHAHKADEYLDVLELEIRTRAALLQGRKVTQLHFGGGTPTFLTKAQISRLMAILRGEFFFEGDAEISIEVDPREIELDMLDHLRGEGFNRLSIGVQDFNKEVQKLVNREQDEEFIFAMVERAKQLGFRSTNLDLIYGLPKQTKQSFAETLKQVLEMKPGRLSVFNYAHMPQLFAAQRKIKDEDLPVAEEKMAILQDTIATLTNAEYQFIGMDHFAQPDDELAVAQRNGVLHRNFQGYTTQGEADLVGFGVSAISMIGDAYAQNQKELKKYYAQVNDQRHALWKGVALDSDDLLRREVIKQLICNFKLDKTKIESEFKVAFNDYFKEDLELLQTFINDELVEVDDKEIRVTLRGRLLIRNICMCFDKYLRAKARQQQFSRVI
ncbi:oxygen-independent coproporphyrinogen III oxidase [Vibrio brasiliensis]|jgi:oxygen-independent coproporphyrinogen-3 oxidase|uniref:Coproporphyrinogen-III oxidase n=1 Tax=Vibrio brasiliensis LMG 20546 TaxID=945543 RepID=E8LUC6_9VIBR|nr:oxygen-independent coproporphyrinogen III oxidase [Vibrio brasiliensis]EGA65669.1 coproporphyrinogen III oxidase [Vibrio brasiliensis LMG 20546]MCG9650889.1 oxygen-independent coproporphyrinogen III oxidase [Vibrio brasiliensis]MCG9728046.1 oxygen-independent coproporphyrinogen III oxidase [Vibrio brasiliensis]MCG9749181.1 oxygen-independent coproporphyrinogen III oxidase [Vibrio brasiliensis]MCG9784887.1 oxygen-independent coproporphyrinogen III oxidase [Vibrio brasiliensis]